jgi:outer membrane lipoprotein-sorting protein
MNRSPIGRNLAVGAALVLSLALARAADDLPKAETILDKYIEATGGKAAYQKHHSEIQKGAIELAAMGLKGTVTTYRAEPDKSYSEIELAGLGRTREGSDGQIFWSLSAMMGPHVKEGAEKAQAELAARFNAELNWRTLFKEAKTTGVDTVDGKECYKVVLTPAEGSAITQCYDKQTNLMVKMTMTAQSPLGEQTVDSFATDYRKEGDVLVAHKIKQSLAGQDMVLSIDSVTFNTEIPKDKFALPDEIKALVSKK